MKLYLSSFQIGGQPDELVRLAGGRDAVVGLITNAGDQWPESTEGTLQNLSLLRELGLDPHLIDLMAFAGAPDDLRHELEKCQGVWVRGGNTFLLRRAMIASGFDEVARPLIESNNLMYGGYSAGVCAITPTLRGLELVDFPYEVPAGYDPEVPWEGMGLVDYAVAPHYRSDHPESADIENVVAYYLEQQIPYRTLRDGEVITVDSVPVAAKERDIATDFGFDA